MSGNIVSSTFSYGSIPLAVAREARDLAERLRTFERNTKDSAVAFGRELIEMKEKLGHGNFGPWVEAELPYGLRTAENLMNAARVFGGKFETVSYFARGYDLQARGSDDP